MTNHADARALEIVCGTGGTAGAELAAHRLDGPRSTAGSRTLGLLRTARPRQWVKNVLVFAAPGTAGVLVELDVIAVVAATFAIFCLAASGTYFFNDAVGVDADRLHPTKSRRPVATGAVDVGLAKVLGALLLGVSVALALALAGWRLALVVGAYAALQPLYSVWLRRVPIADLAVVASGFVLRAVAGAVAVAVPVSNWFLVVTTFGSLFLVSGKRTAEHIDLGEQAPSHRSTLGSYSLGFLHLLRCGAATVAVTAYCLWAIEKTGVTEGAIWFPLSIVPFLLVISRYAVLLDAGRGGCPEELVFEDRALQVLALAWVTVVAVGVHAG